MATFEFHNDPKPTTSKTQFYPPDSITHRMGDGVVLTTSAIVPGIKWAHEFKNSQEGAKPINFIEMCSDYNRRTSVFETGKTVKNNAYFGVNCGCRGYPWFKVDGEDCNHSGMVVDPNLINFILESSVDGLTGSVGTSFNNMSESELESYLQNCKLFEP